MCHSPVEAERALAALRAILAEQSLTLKEAKTDRGAARGRGGPGLSGHSSPPGAREHARLAASVLPGPQARREKTLRKPLLLPVDEVVGDLNKYLRGFASYFRVWILGSQLRPAG
jgi:RNA-directed DNA polymerase